MPDIPIDTSEDAHLRQRDVLLQLGGRERVAIMFRLNDAARRMTVAGIRARHPDYEEDQVQRAYARLVLGDDLMRVIWPDRDLVAP